MFSVNIEKLIKMTQQEKQCFENTVNNLKEELETEEQEIKTIAVIGDGTYAFKLMAAFLEPDKKMLFIDGNVENEIFLQKYKLGKNLKGFSNVMKEAIDMKSIVCVTSNPDIDIVFTGNACEDGYISFDGELIRELLHSYSEIYNTIFVLSDSEGRIASNCDKTIIIEDKDIFNSKEYNEKIENYKSTGCNILGAVLLDIEK